MTGEVVYGATAHEHLVIDDQAPPGPRGRDTGTGEILLLVVVRRGPAFPHEVLGIGQPWPAFDRSDRLQVSSAPLRERGGDGAMERSLDDAWYVANTLAGTPVRAEPWTYLVLTLDGSPAYLAGLREGDHIISTRRDPQGLLTGLDVWRDGQTLHIALEQPTSSADLYYGSYATNHVRLPDGRPTMYQDRRLLGSSAGLAHTLNYLDALTPGDLTAGMRLAVTGEILPDGHIGAISGMREKAQAALKAGADALIVPYDNAAEAEGVASDRIPVIGVATIADVLRYLCWANSDPACRIVGER